MIWGSSQLLHMFMIQTSRVRAQSLEVWKVVGINVQKCGSFHAGCVQIAASIAGSWRM